MCQASCLYKITRFPTHLYYKLFSVENASINSQYGLKTIIFSKASFSQKSKSAELMPRKIISQKKKLFPAHLTVSNTGFKLMQKNGKILARVTVALTGVGVIVFIFTELGAPQMTNTGAPKRDQYSALPIFLQYIMRTLLEIRCFLTLLREPSVGKLLPDRSPGIFQPKYTLILEFTDVLVHSDDTTYKYKKRPGIDHFLEALASIYEIVIYTSEKPITVYPIIEAMDPNNIISYKLVSNNMRIIDGNHFKDLSNINRDLKKVVVVDWNKNCTRYHSENVLAIPRWKGNDDDMSLIHLAEFLQAIAENDIEDVREILKHYSQFNDPLKVFQEKQKKLIDIAEANPDKFMEEGRLWNIIPTIS